MPEIIPIYFYLLLALVSFSFAAVGHGGASGYILIMTLTHFSPDYIRPAALVLNIAVSAVAFLSYSRHHFFNIKIFMPLIIGAIPAVMLGSSIHLPIGIYKKLLAVILLIPVLRLAGIFAFRNKGIVPHQPLLAIVIGAVIGMVSGLLGIGGGIMLSPLLLWLQWSDTKTTAGISALFILINSIVALCGSHFHGLQFNVASIGMLAISFMAAIVGSKLAVSYFTNSTIQRLLAATIFMACIKLIW